MKRLTKEYQAWSYADWGYHLAEYDTLSEALTATRYSDDWYITRRVDFKVVETVQPEQEPEEKVWDIPTPRNQTEADLTENK